MKGMDQSMKTRQHSRGTSGGRGRLCGMNVKVKLSHGEAGVEVQESLGSDHAGSDRQDKSLGWILKASGAVSVGGQGCLLERAPGRRQWLPRGVGGRSPAAQAKALGRESGTCQFSGAGTHVA